MVLMVLANKTNIEVYPTGYETPKAIQCDIYRTGSNPLKDRIWIPKSQIESFEEDCIYVTVWWFNTIGGEVFP